jgi:hypothetical protein
LLIDLKHWLQEEFGIYLNSSTTLPSLFVHHCCYLAIAERVTAIPAHTTQNNLGFVVPPLEEVGLGHGDKSEQTRSLTLPPAAPVFTTQPLTHSRMISG